MDKHLRGNVTGDVSFVRRSSTGTDWNARNTMMGIMLMFSAELPWNSMLRSSRCFYERASNRIPHRNSTTPAIRPTIMP
jgi:hypothetical protein